MADVQEELEMESKSESEDEEIDQPENPEPWFVAMMKRLDRLDRN